MFGIDINGYEILILLVIAVVVLGPDKLPDYAARLGQLVRNLRGYAEGAKGQLREQMGPEFDDIDWKQYDPRQYDPRRIVREALRDDDGTDLFGLGSSPATQEPPVEHLDAEYDPAAFPVRGGHRYDPTFTPFDVDAT